MSESVGPAVSGTGSPVRITERDSQKVKLVFGHADSGELLATADGTTLPIPETDEPIRFGEIGPDETGSQAANVGDETYVVVGREYHYFDVDIADVPEREESACLVTVVVRVLPEATIEK
ncbi:MULTISPECIES: hypothetical protein [Halococcus]|uniref:Uncharacterized protein n=1 Tax=Halococcus salifodinae DSM 8989 TaxID=1227456 RepID=M0MXL5_9EURY|nr:MULTISPECIES: hypothetical protein [Halococcus]EMA49170.1 hypothetical protein C450_17943 [Halococcus salifodinae DSM 8989]